MTCKTGSLGERLIATVDRARAIPEGLGLRSYSVRLVWTRWSGGRRGEGTEVIETVETLSPTPRLLNPSSLAIIASIRSSMEEGSILVDRISGRYSEDFLRGYDSSGNPVGPAQDFYYEVEFKEVAGRKQGTRRYNLTGHPGYSDTKFSWRVSLTRTSNVDPATRENVTEIGEVL